MAECSVTICYFGEGLSKWSPLLSEGTNLGYNTAEAA